MEVKTVYEKNTCCKCGKEYNQVAIISSFGIILNKYCDECIDEFEKDEKAKSLNRQKKIRESFYRSRGIREKYRNVTLDNYLPQTESQKQALNACKNLKDGFINKLVLLGGNGVGKTHLACALVKIMDGRIITAFELYALYRSCFSGENTEIDLLHKLQSYPLLVIDEVGRTKGSEAEENFFSALIDARDSDGKRTIMLSNLIRKRDCVFLANDKDACGKRQCKNCIESWLTPDLISRFRNNSCVIYIQGYDYRNR